MSKILIVQTAYIGDVILATSLIEYLAKSIPNAQLHFALRKGNETLLLNNPHLKKIHIWDKKRKVRSLIQNIFAIRKEKYDFVINIQRFFNSGLMTILSGARYKIGFDKNPLSFLFSYKVEHLIPHKYESTFLHEVQRNFLLLQQILQEQKIPSLDQLQPKLYFGEKEERKFQEINPNKEYLVMAPTSVWFTKQWHISKWKELIQELERDYLIYLIGAPSDLQSTKDLELSPRVINLCGKLSLLESARLMKNAKRVFVNDSAPLHLASSVNAKSTAIFCSTVPDFGYFGLSSDSELIQVNPRLECMPCGLHGHKDCPKSHFDCAHLVDTKDVIRTIK